MRARLISSEPEEGGLVVLALEQGCLNAMDCLGHKGGRPVRVGEEFEVEFSCLHGEGEDWHVVFTSNPRKERRLERIGLWSYRAFGEVVRVEGQDQDEAIADCGICQLPLPISVSDPSCVGQFVGFTIQRLDAWRA